MKRKRQTESREWRPVKGIDMDGQIVDSMNTPRWSEKVEENIKTYEEKPPFREDGSEKVRPTMSLANDEYRKIAEESVHEDHGRPSGDTLVKSKIDDMIVDSKKAVEVEPVAVAKPPDKRAQFNMSRDKTQHEFRYWPDERKLSEKSDVQSENESLEKWKRKHRSKYKMESKPEEKHNKKHSRKWTLKQSDRDRKVMRVVEIGDEKEDAQECRAQNERRDMHEKKKVKEPDKTVLECMFDTILFC